MILGCDPGYRNLGLSLYDTETKQVVLAKTVNCGSQPLAFAKVLLRELPDFEAYGPVKIVATERPPYSFGRATKHAAMIWCVMGALSWWATHKFGATFRPLSVDVIKGFAARAVGEARNEGGTRTDRKRQVKDAVKKMTTYPEGHTPTDHENDATLAAIIVATRA